MTPLARRFARLQRINFGLILAVIFLAVALFVTLTRQGRSETMGEWIHRTHPACCDHRDCIPVRATKLPVGWLVGWHGAEVPYNGQVRPSPAETTACGTPTVIRCLFVSGGTS